MSVARRQQGDRPLSLTLLPTNSTEQTASKAIICTGINLQLGTEDPAYKRGCLLEARMRHSLDFHFNCVKLSFSLAELHVLVGLSHLFSLSFWAESNPKRGKATLSVGRGHFDLPEW